MFDQFQLTLAAGQRKEALGPLFYQEYQDDISTWAIPPLMSSVRDPDTDRREFDFLYPAMTYDRFGTEYRFEVFQLFSFSGGGLQSGETVDRITLFPFYFQQRSADKKENYTALFPLFGTMRNHFFRDQIDFALWPLYVKTIRHRAPGTGTVGANEFLSLGHLWARSRRREVTTYNFVAPIFHLRFGDGLRGWQVWPLMGHELKTVTTRTNNWGDQEVVPGHESSFVLWPFWLHDQEDIGTTNASDFKALLPFFTKLRSLARDSTSYGWLFGLTLTDDRARRYHETDFLWPLFVFARGEGKTTTRIGPLFSRSHNDTMERNFYLWPLYKYTRLHSDPLDRKRTRILFALYSDKRETDTVTGREARRVDLWPLFTHKRDRAGNTRLQVLSLIEPILPTSTAIERNYSLLWSLWRSEHNARSGASSQSFLWNLYRHQVSAKGDRKTSLLFGLFQHRKRPTGDSALNILFIPVKRFHAPTLPTVDSTNQMTHLPAGANP